MHATSARSVITSPCPFKEDGSNLCTKTQGFKGHKKMNHLSGVHLHGFEEHRDIFCRCSMPFKQHVFCAAPNDNSSVDGRE